MEKRLGKLEVLWRSSADEAVHAAAWAIEGHLRYGDLGADQRTIARRIITEHGPEPGDVRRAVLIALRRLQQTNTPDDPMGPDELAAATSLALGELFQAVSDAYAHETEAA